MFVFYNSSSVLIKVKYNWYLSFYKSYSHFLDICRNVDFLSDRVLENYFPDISSPATLCLTIFQSLTLPTFWQGLTGKLSRLCDNLYLRNCKLLGLDCPRPHFLQSFIFAHAHSSAFSSPLYLFRSMQTFLEDIQASENLGWPCTLRSPHNLKHLVQILFSPLEHSGLIASTLRSHICRSGPQTLLLWSVKIVSLVHCWLLEYTLSDDIKILVRISFISY